MMRRIVLIILFTQLVAATRLQAQSYSSVHYDTKDGLTSATVYNISQDKNGFIWFGTENGLCRFDGKNFKTFTTRDGLPDNSILMVQADSSGRMYFLPFTHGLQYYQNDSFFKFPIPEKFKIDLSSINGMTPKGKHQMFVWGIVNSYIIENDQITP